MEISRHVILDLLPVYVAGEASEDPRRLVETELAADSRLAAAARDLRSVTTEMEASMPINTDLQLAAFQEAKRLQLRTTMIWAGIIGLSMFFGTALALLAAFLMFRG